MTRLALLLVVAIGYAAPATPHDDMACFEWMCMMAQVEDRPKVQRRVAADSVVHRAHAAASGRPISRLVLRVGARLLVVALLVWLVARDHYVAAVLVTLGWLVFGLWRTPRPPAKPRYDPWPFS
jgi:hypothetical protein